MIPKYIHQIWIQGKTNIPKKYLDRINSIKALNPDFTYILWDNDRILNSLNQFPKLLEYYKNIEDIEDNNINYNASRSDIGRILALYLYGGVYMDIDVSCIGSLNSIISKFPDKQDIIASPRFDIIVRKFVSSAFIIASTNNSLLNTILQKMPLMKSQSKLGKLFDVFAQSYKNIYIIPSDDVSCYHCGKISTCMIPFEIGSSKTYSLHLYSWWCNNKGMLCVLVIVLLLCVIYYILKYKRYCSLKND